jgi:hypothetical protein
MLTKISWTTLQSDQLYTWSDEYTERTRCCTAKTPRRSCASTAPAQIDPARLPHRALQAMRQAELQMRRRARTWAQILSFGELSTLARCQLIPTTDHRRGFPCCVWSLFVCMPSPIPRQDQWNLVRSNGSINVGLPSIVCGSAPALPVSRPAQRSHLLRPTDLPSSLRSSRPVGFHHQPLTAPYVKLSFHTALHSNQVASSRKQPLSGEIL